MNLLIFSYLFLAPLSYALVNLLDKYVVSQRVKHPMSYVVLVGTIQLVLASILAFFSDWTSLKVLDYFWGILIGISYGFQLIIYYYLFSKEDVTNIVGIDFTFPVVVAILSAIFLGERFGMQTYIGLSLAVLGTVVIALRMLNFTFSKVTFLLLLMVLNTGIYEFLIKLSTLNVSQINILVLNSLFAGITVLFLLFKKDVRSKIKISFKLWKWALFIEALTMLSIFFIILSLNYFPATIASAIATLQPLFVLFGERIISGQKESYSKDKNVIPKLIGILLICLGTVLILLKA
ncbi:MAG TPA: EamA family transporter [Candidatus Nanoarchaeia archaeon]|nr:EamA family transporter [Candidatus Nanoarchaeia archaeon]